MADPWGAFAPAAQPSATDPWAGFTPANANNPAPAAIDTSGAPAAVRAAVGAVPDNGDARLQAIRKFYPDAQPQGDGNFVYTDPKTQKATLYNPPGLDMGDIASLLPEAAELVGGTAGAVVGTAGGATAGSAVPVVGTVAGGIAGGMAGAGTGATFAREAVQRAAMALMGVKDNRSAGDQATDAAKTFAINAGGEGAGMIIGTGVRAASRAIGRGLSAGADAAPQVTADLSKFGVTPGTLQVVQSARAQVISDAAQKQSQTVAKAVSDKLANLNSNVAPDTMAAGNAASQGVTDFAKNFQDKAAVLYNKVASFIPSDTPVQGSNTERTLNDIVNPAQGAPNVTGVLVNPKLAALADAFGKDSSNGAMTYSVMQDLRSSIGRKLGSPSLVDDIPRAQLKQIYGAMTDDLRIAAQTQGPDALKAFDRASTFYKAGMDRIDNMLTPLVQNKMPEDVFAGIQTAAAQGPSRLRALRQSVSPQQWQAVAGAVADRLGRAAPGQQAAEGGSFSFKKFLTNWQKIDDGAKDVLFSGPNMNGIRADLDTLARVSGRARDVSTVFPTSGIPTQPTAWSATTAALKVIPDLPVILGAALGTTSTGAKLLTNKPFVHWLAQSTTVKPAGIAAHIGRLGAIAQNSDSDTRDAITSYLGALQQTQGQN